MEWIRRARQSWPCAGRGQGVKWSSVYICEWVFFCLRIDEKQSWNQQGWERCKGVPAVNPQIRQGWRQLSTNCFLVFLSHPCRDCVCMSVFIKCFKRNTNMTSYLLLNIPAGCMEPRGAVGSQQWAYLTVSQEAASELGVNVFYSRVHSVSRHCCKGQWGQISEQKGRSWTLLEPFLTKYLEHNVINSGNTPKAKSSLSNLNLQLHYIQTHKLMMQRQ